MLTKPENKINWKDSNLALFGSDLEKKIKEAAAGKEEAWEGLGNSVVLKVWRIEKFQVKGKAIAILPMIKSSFFIDSHSYHLFRMAQAETWKVSQRRLVHRPEYLQTRSRQ